MMCDSILAWPPIGLLSLQACCLQQKPVGPGKHAACMQQVVSSSLSLSSSRCYRWRRLRGLREPWQKLSWRLWAWRPPLAAFCMTTSGKALLDHCLGKDQGSSRNQDCQVLKARDYAQLCLPQRRVQRMRTGLPNQP